MINLKGHTSIETAWQRYRDFILKPDATKADIRAARLAFWAGASTLFYCLMTELDEGDEPTNADMKKMERLSDEVEKFTATFDDEVIRDHGGVQ